MNGSRILKIMKPNGVYLVFGDFATEDSFPEFLKFLEDKLRVKVGSVEQGPYSMASELSLAGTSFLAMFHDDTGCCLLVASENGDLADSLIDECTS